MQESGRIFLFTKGFLIWLYFGNSSVLLVLQRKEAVKQRAAEDSKVIGNSQETKRFRLTGGRERGHYLCSPKLLRGRICSVCLTPNG